MEIRFFQDKPKVIATLAAKISQSPLSKSLKELYEESKKEGDFGYRIMEKYNHRIFGGFFELCNSF